MANSPVVSSLSEKVDRLIADNRKLKADRDAALARQSRLREENRELTDRITALEKRIMVLELKDGLGGNSEDNKLAKARVNRLMREVDKCIALLNR